MVCDTLKTPVYAGTTRTCVFNMSAWCRHTRGRFECMHGEGGRGEGGEEGEGEGGRRQPRVFHR